LTRDAIADGLKRRREDRRIVGYLNPAEIAALLKACEDHDREMDARRATPAVRGRPRLRHAATVAPFVRFVLLTGVRLNEALTLDWAQVDLNAGRLVITAANAKTHQERIVDLATYSPTVVELLTALPKREGRVFAEQNAETAKATAQRLVQLGAPPATGWQMLRRTCCTYASNLPSMGPWVSAKRAGHSVVVAESRYAGLLKLPPDVATLEAAMGLDKPSKPGGKRAGTAGPKLRVVAGGVS
jgi:integrase